MSGYAGDIALGDTIDVKFTTVSTTGAPTTLAGSPVISAYVGNGTTEITAGITLTVDFDSRTGYHNIRVVASGGNGFASQTNVSLAITTGTVGGTSVVGYEVASFSIDNRSALRPTTAGRTLVVDANGLADANVVKLGPTGSGTAQTARDVGASVIVASGTVTTVTNQLTAAQIATGVWQDATASDFTTASSIGKSLYTTGNAPGAASGLALVGSNMGTVSSVTGAVGSVTANVNADVKKINGTTVTGDGSVGTPWGP